ncbi:hypothetical protein BE21_45060 [Sorangium cellulosum]|uniref:Amidohydrolase-related domain-containing protein n=1 Tax=Sorangium cellulosum TaxID=56 RepID=A0A150TJI2_SORCE|nr:hypothetical protein BE21_45060 [Sorangium cellulosum]
MTDRIARLKASPSVAVKEKLDYPVIDTDIHTNDYSPALEDFVATYGGAKLVDDLRKALSSRRRNAENSSGKDWYTQTPEERQHYRTVRSPWWARVTRNTLDVATYHLPSLLAERLEEQGSDYSVLFPNNTLAPLAVKDRGARQALTRAINHYHADLFRKYSDRLTPVAGIPLNTPEEGIEELEFAVKELGLKAINISGGVRRPIKSIAEKYPPDQHPEIAKYARQPPPEHRNDFAAAGIEKIEDIRDRWVNNFFFGSESDDRTIAAAFNDKANPLGAKINAIYSSDVGHWDVPDLTEALAESWNLVEEGIISAEDFKAYVFENPYKLYTEANASFFKGTRVEEKLKQRAQAKGDERRGPQPGARSEGSPGKAIEISA